MNLATLEWLNGEKDEWRGMKISHALAEHRFRGTENAIGVDPGRRWGMGILLDGILYAYWGILPAPDKNIEYFDYISDFVATWLPKNIPSKLVFVEGASYGEKFGQILLEDIRFSFELAFKKRGCEVSLVPPKTARKIVFGNGNTKASEIWVKINGNGADGACLALYGGGYKFE